MGKSKETTSVNANLPALILKMTRSPVHHGALGVARTLGRRGVRVYAVVEDAFTPVAVSRYLTKAFVWDNCPNDSRAFVKAMSLIADRIACPMIILIPMDDLSAVSVAENAVDLSRWFLIPRVLPQVPHKLANKACLQSLCTQIGISSARSVVPRCFDDVRSFVASTGFPVVVKASEQWLPVNDHFCTKVIETRDELFDLCEYYEYQGKHSIIIQEHIPGEDWIAHGYYNSEKNLSLTFVGRKLVAYPNEAGSTALGLSTLNPELQYESERLLKSVAYSGIIDMDWRKDARDGQYKLLDCNPRIGQNFRMFENDNGIDVALAQYLDLSGQVVEKTSPKERRLFAVESFCALALLRSSAARQWKPRCQSYEVTELAWWAADDPVPFFLMTLRVGMHVFRRLMKVCIRLLLRSRLLPASRRKSANIRGSELRSPISEFKRP